MKVLSLTNDLKKKILNDEIARLEKIIQVSLSDLEKIKSKMTARYRAKNKILHAEELYAATGHIDFRISLTKMSIAIYRNVLKKVARGTDTNDLNQILGKIGERVRRESRKVSNRRKNLAP